MKRNLKKELEQAEEEQRLEDWLIINSAKKCAPMKARELEREYHTRYGMHYDANDFKYCDGVGWVRG